jgi:hypothetical protein
MADHSKIATAFGIVGTLAAIYFAASNYMWINVPTLELQIENPPPYRTENDTSTVRIKNVGSRTSGIVNVFVECSWDGDFEYHLKFPSPRWVLRPNEDYHWTIRLAHSADISKEYVKLIAVEGTSRFEVTTRLHQQNSDQTLHPAADRK